LIDDRTPLAELLRDAVTAAAVFVVIGVGAVFVITLMNHVLK
jgi:hypothetical protein